MNSAFVDSIRASEWNSICRQAEGHAIAMSTRWSDSVKWEVRFVLRQLTDQAVPDTVEEMSIRRVQSMGLTAIIGSVAHIESMGAPHRAYWDEFMQLVKKVCTFILPETSEQLGRLHNRLMAVAMEVATLSNNAMSERFLPL